VVSELLIVRIWRRKSYGGSRGGHSSLVVQRLKLALNAISLRIGQPGHTHARALQAGDSPGLLVGNQDIYPIELYVLVLSGISLIYPRHARCRKNEVGKMPRTERRKAKSC